MTSGGSVDTNRDLKVVVSAHGPAWVPEGGEFVPVLAGSACLGEGESVPDGWLRDDTGDNVSERHAALGDLCALYWAWRNLDADVLGFACGGRYLASNYRLDRRRRVASGDFLAHRVASRGVVLPSETNYFVVTNSTQFGRDHDSMLLDVARDVLGELCPEYVGPFVRSLRITHGHHANLLLMRRDLADAFCEWLFEVLFDVEASFAGVAPEALGGGALPALAGYLLDPWLDVTGTRFVEVSSVRLDGDRRSAPSDAGYLAERYRAKYGGGS